MLSHRRGESVLLRNVRGGGVRCVEPATVVSDDGSVVAIYRPPTTPLKVRPSFLLRGDPIARETASKAEARAGAWDMRDTTWTGTHVRADAVAGRWASRWTFWDEDWNHVCWYVNFEAPWRRWRRGYDTDDLCLDIVVAPDGSWQWKDLDDFRDRVAEGLITGDEEAAVKQAVEEELRAIERHDPPFDGCTLGWRPDPSWTVPSLGDDWDAPIDDRVPGPAAD